jgi:short-subunit dehydrogenase
VSPARLETWSGERVLVTGASSGIGRALALELATAGAVVGLCARRTALLDEVLAACQALQPGCRAWTIDLAELDGLPPFVHQVEEELGGVDVLVNNAGLALSGSALAADWSDVEYLARLDYLSPVRLARAVLPAMVARGRGHIVTISSMAARMSTPGEAAYAGAKAALAAYFEALAGELWSTPIGIHLVYPALIELSADVDGDDAIAETSNGADLIPAPVCAREIMRQVERGDLELYVPRTMSGVVAERASDVARSVAFMARWFEAGSPHV